MTRSFRPLSSAVLLAFVAASGCAKGGGSDADEEKKSVQAVVGAQVAVATAQPFTEYVGAIGVVQPRAGHVASLSAPAPTRVARVLAVTGEHVNAGQPLVELDRSAFQAVAQSAEAAVAAAERNYERQLRLSQEGIVARKDVEQAAADLAKARADLVVARRSSELAVLRAPMSGVVIRMSAVLGASVDANQPLVDVADPSAVDVLLNVTPADAARVHPGQKVTMSAGQSAAGEPLGIGTVVDISGTVDTVTRSVSVRVQPPVTRRPLRIGETVFGEIGVATHANAVTVPNESLVPEGESFKVFVVDAGGTAHARPVTVGGRTTKLAEITSGLRAGEKVVTYGAYGVEDSAKVVPLERDRGAAAPAPKS